jgi:hypothetical protein
MDLGLVLLGFVGVVLAVALVHVVGRMASEREAAARRKRNEVQPLAGDTITYAGHS